MRTPESIEALRRANPRARAGFAESAGAATEELHARVVAAARAAGLEAGAPAAVSGAAPDGQMTGRSRAARRRFRPRRRLVGVSTLGASLTAAVALAAFLAVSSPGVGSAAAAVRKAATVTAASAERSGTAVVRMTHDGKPWTGATIRWHGHDLSVVSDTPGQTGRNGRRLLLVHGTLYGTEPVHGGWVELGSPRNIDPNSGTTPDEYLAAVREDVGGTTLRRLTAGMTGLTTRKLGDGSTVYSGSVAAGLVARETGFKEGQTIRVLPFGYVAHDEAADPASPLHVAVTVGADSVVRQIAVSWGSGASVWTYTVSYSRLGSTSAPVAPAHARSLIKDRLRPSSR
jgi:hypothetical protein